MSVDVERECMGNEEYVLWNVMGIPGVECIIYWDDECWKFDHIP